MDLNKYKLNNRGYWIERVTQQPVHRMVYFTAFPKASRAFHIHHINGIKDDNRIENLIGLSQKDHTALHTRFPMHSLPNRELIGKWLKIRDERCQVNVKRKKKTRVKGFFCSISGKWYPEINKQKLERLKRNFEIGNQLPQKYLGHPTIINLKKESAPKRKLFRAKVLVRKGGVKSEKPKPQHSVKPIWTWAWDDEFLNQRWERFK